jgi:hypothetical protein
VWASGRIDITDRLIKALDDTHPTPAPAGASPTK